MPGCTSKNTCLTSSPCKKSHLIAFLSSLCFFCTSSNILKKSLEVLYFSYKNEQQMNCLFPLEVSKGCSRMWKVLLASVLPSAAGGLSVCQHCIWCCGMSRRREALEGSYQHGNSSCLYYLAVSGTLLHLVEKAVCVLIYRLYAEMNWRWMLLVTPRLSCRTEQRWKVSSLESLAFLKWKMLMYFPEMHSASLFLVFSTCQVAYL